jgi:integrase
MGLYQRPNGVWYARWTKRGALERRSLNTTSRRDAEAKYRELTGKPLTRRPRAKKEAQRGAAAVDWRTKPESLGEMTDRWAYHLKHRSHMKVGSIEAYMVQLRRWKERWGHLKPGELDAETIADWHEDRAAAPGKRADNTAKATLKFEVRCLQLFLRWCANKKYIDEIPDLPVVSGISKKEPRALSPLQLRALFDARPRHPRPQVRALHPVLMLGLHAGLRREEIRFLAWKDVDLSAGLLRVTAKPPHFSPKDHEERSIPLSPELHELLKELRAGSPEAEWVCLNCEFGQWSLGLTKWTRELFKAAGVEREHGTLHRLRHSFGTRLLHAGVDIETVRDLMGHADISTTGRYLSTTDPRKRAAVAALSGATFEL